jgi:hypothetical protein
MRASIFGHFPQGAATRDVILGRRDPVILHGGAALTSEGFYVGPAVRYRGDERNDSHAD